MQQVDIPDEITIITTSTEPVTDEYDRVRYEDEGTYGRVAPQEHKIKITKLTQEINVLLAQMEVVLKDAKPSVGAFQFSEFQVSAAITASGKVNILGFGGEAGVEGGLKFVFKRT